MNFTINMNTQNDSINQKITEAKNIINQQIKKINISKSEDKDLDAHILNSNFNFLENYLAIKQQEIYDSQAIIENLVNNIKSEDLENFNQQVQENLNKYSTEVIKTQDILNDIKMFSQED